MFSWGSVDMAMWQSFGAAVWLTGTGCEADLSSWHACGASLARMGCSLLILRAFSPVPGVLVWVIGSRW